MSQMIVFLTEKTGPYSYQLINKSNEKLNSKKNLKMCDTFLNLSNMKFLGVHVEKEKIIVWSFII